MPSISVRQSTIVLAASLVVVACSGPASEDSSSEQANTSESFKSGVYVSTCNGSPTACARFPPDRRYFFSLHQADGHSEQGPNGTVQRTTLLSFHRYVFDTNKACFALDRLMNNVAAEGTAKNGLWRQPVSSQWESEASHSPESLYFRLDGTIDNAIRYFVSPDGNDFNVTYRYLAPGDMRQPICSGEDECPAVMSDVDLPASFVQPPPPPGDTNPDTSNRDNRCTNQYNTYPGCPSSPLVLHFAPTPISLVSKAVPFDLRGDGTAHPVTWLATGSFLALDLDGDGTINSGRELFGQSTRLPDGSLAKDGFAALARYDENHDGVISGDDAVFPRLLLWWDVNQDGVSAANELTTLEHEGVIAIHLDARPVDHPTDTTSYVGLSAAFEQRTEPLCRVNRQVADVWFATKPTQ